MDIWFTSDSHYGHKNIAGPTVSDWGSGYRGFDSVDAMNEALVESYNVAKKNDIIYHNGDWSFGGHQNIVEFRNKIVCDNIHLVTGNHDKHIRKHAEHFTRVAQVIREKIGGKNFFLSHYAHKVWDGSGDGAYMLYGHSHGTLPDDPNLLSMDVGWDTCLFGHKKHTLYHIDEIISIMNTKTWQPVDHHGRAK